MRLLYHVVKPFDQNVPGLDPTCSSVPWETNFCKVTLFSGPLLSFPSHTVPTLVYCKQARHGPGNEATWERGYLEEISSFTLRVYYASYNTSTITMATAHMLPFQHPTLHTHWPHFTRTLLGVTYMHLENPMFFFTCLFTYSMWCEVLEVLGYRVQYCRWAKPWECPYTQQMIGIEYVTC